MKNIYKLILAVLIFSNEINAQCIVPTFTFSTPSGTVLGCNPPTLPLSAINTSTLTGVTYTWNSITTGSTIGSSINATCPGGFNTYSVFSSAPTSTCIFMQTISISQNTTAPVVNANPPSGNLTCNGAPANFTAVAIPAINTLGQWFGPGNVPASPLSGSPILGSFNAPGTYYAIFTNITNGCSTTKTVVVSSASVIPTMTITSPQGFNISCNNLCLPMFIATSSTLAPKSFSWTNMATFVTTTPATGGYTICVPGNYLAEFSDGNFCKVSQMVNVSIDTIRPSPTALSSLAGNSYTLDCYNPCMTATAISNPLLPISNYSWTTPPNLTVASNTVAICLANITSSVTPTNYTVLAMGTNGCIGKAKIAISKNVYVPPYTIAFTPSVITCLNPCVIMSPQTTFTTPVTFTFVSPAPTATSNLAGWTTCIPGTYTMNYTNVFNGCPGVTNAVVPLNITPPATVAVSPSIIFCGSSTVIIIAGSLPTFGYGYNWTGPGGAGISSPTSYSTAVNMAGNYSVTITNTTTGCTATNVATVNQSTNAPVTISGSNTICIGDSTTLSASGATSYTWNTGSNAISITVSPTVTTSYTINGTNTLTSCSGQSILTVTVSSCVGVEELFVGEPVVKLLPNPNNGQFTLLLNTPIENGEVKIINALGQEIFKQNIKTGNNEINISNYAKGIYHYVILQEKQTVRSGKLLIQ